MIHDHCEHCFHCAKRITKPPKVEPGQVWIIRRLRMVIVILRHRIYTPKRKKFRGHRWVSLFHFGDVSVRYGETPAEEILFHGERGELVGMIDDLLDYDFVLEALNA